MQSTEKTSNCIPTSFSATSESGEGDSVSSLQPEIIPESNVDQESNAVDFESNDVNIEANAANVESHAANMGSKVFKMDSKATPPESNAVDVASSTALSESNAVDMDTSAADIQPDAVDMDLNVPNDDPNAVQVDANAADVEAKSIDMDANAADVEPSVGDGNASAPEVEPSAIDMNTNPDDIDADEAGVEQNVVDMETNAADIQQNAVDIQLNAADLESNAAELESNAADLESNVADLESNVADLESNVADLESNAADLESNVADLESSVADLESNAIDMQSAEQSLDVSLQKSPIISENNLEKSKSENTSALNVFEEDARSSWSEEPKPREFKETALDENSQNSASSQKSASKKPSSEDGENKREFPPENLFEYMWPQENGEFFILQEQICDYLNVKSFKRKYPDLFRRSVEVAEKQFLKEKGVVTEMQCDLGLTALRSEEVLELMSKDYPDHYKEYIKVLREKEQQSISEKHKEYVATNSDKNKMVDLVKKAVQSAAEYNAHLNQERREERKSCMDLQTFTIHYPAKPNKIKKTTKPGKYPVALLPGQFQDYYKEYTPEELKYLPVNTVLYGPLKELNSIKAQSDGSQSDSDDSTASDGSCCSSSQGTQDDSSSGSEKPDINKKPNTPGSPHQPKTKQNAVCKVCKVGADGKLKEGKPEELVHCSDCENSAHPSCIELTPDVVAVLKTYPWQCMDCKVCSQCKEPNEEDKMLFCDTCDRGYHTFCVGLKSLPQGRWICRQCGACSMCGCNRPGPELSKAQWQYDFSKGNEADVKNRHPKLLCMSCSKKKR